MISCLRATHWRLIDSPKQIEELIRQYRIAPDIASSGIAELCLLPGVGNNRAMELIRTRASLGVPLNLDNLHLLPGFGHQSSADIRKFLNQSSE